MSTGKLYLVPSVIAGGEMQTIPAQVKDTLGRLRYFLAEKSRTGRRYISDLKLGLTIDSLEFQEFNKDTTDAQLELLMQPIFDGVDIGILSESGCPGVADPGSRAVEFAHKNDIKVIPLVGPSSILLALMASGFNGQKFCFHGYLPIDKDKLKSSLKNLERNSAAQNQTEIFIEAPYRNNQLLENLKKLCNANTRLCIACDITGEEEFIETKTILEWRSAKIIDLHKRPTVFLLYAH